MVGDMRLTHLYAAWAAIALITTTAPAQARAPAASVANPAMWQVKDADTTIYLFGTVHVLKPGIDWFRGGVKAAFDRSDELVLEIIEPDDPNVMGAIMMTRALAKDGVALSDRLTPDARGKYQAAMDDNGLPWRTFDRMNPWMAGMALSVAPLAKLGYQAELGAEKALRGAAVQAGKTGATVMGGAVVMLLVAGLLEGIGRQTVTNDLARYAIGSVMLVGWLLYFYLPRSRRDGVAAA